LTGKLLLAETVLRQCSQQAASRYLQARQCWPARHHPIQTMVSISGPAALGVRRRRRECLSWSAGQSVIWSRQRFAVSLHSDDAAAIEIALK